MKIWKANQIERQEKSLPEVGYSQAELQAMFTSKNLNEGDIDKQLKPDYVYQSRHLIKKAKEVKL